MKIPFSQTFTPDQPLRDARARHDSAKSKINKARADAASRRAEREKVIGQQASADTVDMAVVRQAGELEILAGIGDTTAAQVSAKIPGIIKEIDGRHYQLARAVNEASTQARAALAEHVRRLLAPLFKDAAYRREFEADIAFNRAVAEVLSASAPDAAFGFHDRRLSCAAEEGGELGAADDLLEKFVAFSQALKKFAAFLPKNFAPFPATAEEMDEKFPLPKPAPAPEDESRTEKSDGRQPYRIDGGTMWFTPEEYASYQQSRSATAPAAQD